MSREAHVRICERLGSGDPGRLDFWLPLNMQIQYPVQQV